MQSTRRKLLRGNAVMVISEVTKRPEIIEKKGSTKEVWNHALKNQAKETMFAYCQSITKPITKAMILKAEQKGQRHIVNMG